ncbi:hypothetical protein L596_022930 [Steinernema carpocapsae]|uniref:FAD/NAD(P)-binding domain-containing protein n=1 Tax=Steinernema carpocapsae TaxID=34508 RepID=A0A4U5MC17_STECR|nr:hypothetical protein L596_022930 [Steinernema carpocapsae]
MLRLLATFMLRPLATLVATEPKKKFDGLKVPPFRGMDVVPYLLIGGGTASYYASLAIRARDSDAKVLVVGEEEDMPYNRPPLSKELWLRGDPETLHYKSLSGKPKDIYYESAGFYVKPEALVTKNHGAVSLLKGTKVVKLDIANHVAHLDNGEKIRYRKCLIATGATPKTLPVFDEVKDNTILYKTISDYHRLDKIAHQKDARIAIVGGGILASELAFSIPNRYHASGVTVAQIVPGSGAMSDMLPEFLVSEVTSAISKEGTHVYAKDSVAKAEKTEDGRVQLTLASGKVVVADAVVVDAGTEPNVQLGKDSGIAVDEKNGGLIADTHLKAAEDVWVAGDVCSYEDPVLGRRRYTQWEVAQVLGRQAGENMTGGEKTLPRRGSSFTIFGPKTHFFTVGDVDSKMSTVSVFAKPSEVPARTNSRESSSISLKPARTSPES